MALIVQKYGGTSVGSIDRMRNVAARMKRTRDEGNQVVRVRREEAAWRSRVVAVREAHWGFPEGCEAALGLCYEVEPIEYRWERGRRVRVQPCA